MSLDLYSDKELKEELERREREARPDQLENPDLARLRTSCREYTDYLIFGYPVKGHCRIICEIAMETFYGGDIFETAKGRH